MRSCVECTRPARVSPVRCPSGCDGLRTTRWPHRDADEARPASYPPFDAQRPSLTGPSEPIDGGRRLLGKPTTCVGRERELRALEDLLDECASEDVARVVLVTAGAGVGNRGCATS